MILFSPSNDLTLFSISSALIGSIYTFWSQILLTLNNSLGTHLKGCDCVDDIIIVNISHSLEIILTDISNHNEISLDIKHWQPKVWAKQYDGSWNWLQD